MPFNVHPHEDSLNYGPKIDCPKHGIHGHIIHSSIAGHKGDWCQICWLETLGPSLPLITSPSEPAQ
jgi:hypothetical protein